MKSGYPTSRDLAKSQGQATPEKNSADRTNSVNGKKFLKYHCLKIFGIHFESCRCNDGFMGVPRSSPKFNP